MEEKILVCKKCGAKITKEALEYAKKHGDRFPEDADYNTIHADDCGCRYADENYGDACHCEFE